MPLSNKYANNYLNFLFSKVSTLAAPETVYLGLTTNDPVADKGVIQELSGDTYARKLVSIKGNTLYPGLISSAANRVIQNVEQIAWTKATKENWPKARGWILMDAPTGGDLIFYGRLEQPILCEVGAIAEIDPNSLKISFPMSDVSRIPLMLEQDVAGFALNETMGVYMVSKTPAPFMLTAEKEYYILWDDIAYYMTGVAFTSGDADCVAIGNALASGGENDGCPFAVIYDVTNHLLYFCAMAIQDDATTDEDESLQNMDTHNIGIYQMLE